MRFAQQACAETRRQEPNELSANRTAGFASRIFRLGTGNFWIRRFNIDNGGTIAWRTMTADRLETFHDGVVAILITIMVLDLRVPVDATWPSLKARLPLFLIYALSFVFLGIYWNNHHHMFTLVDSINGVVMWANLNLLFWLSLIPFVTRWLGDEGVKSLPVAMYGFVALMAAISYYILARTIIALQGSESPLAVAFGGDFKGKASVIAYAVAIGVAFLVPWASIALFAAVSLMWLIPDRRIEVQSA
jgi:uncharacterized membrane protein